MWPREDMEWTYEGVRYRVANSTLIAHNWDNATIRSVYSTTFLYRTFEGRYFAVHMTRIENKPDQFEALTTEEARDLYILLRKKEVPIETAFPGVGIQGA